MHRESPNGTQLECDKQILDIWGLQARGENSHLSLLAFKYRNKEKNKQNWGFTNAFRYKSKSL